MRDRKRWALAVIAVAVLGLWCWRPWSTAAPRIAEPASELAAAAATSRPDRSARDRAGRAHSAEGELGSELGVSIGSSGSTGSLAVPVAQLEAGVDSSTIDGPRAQAGPLRSFSSDERVEPTIANTCPVAVELHWVDFDGRERSYGALSAGETRAMSTYRGHAWTIRTLDGTELRSFIAGAGSIETCDADHSPGAAAYSAARQRREWPERASARSIEHARISVRNACEADLELFWVDFEGHERRYASLASGAELDQSTFRGHLWRLRSVDGREVQTFRAEADGTYAACETLGFVRDA